MLTGILSALKALSFVGPLLLQPAGYKLGNDEHENRGRAQPGAQIRLVWPLYVGPSFLITCGSFMFL